MGAEVGKKGKGKRREKKKEKGRKNGVQNRFFFFYVHAQVFFLDLVDHIRYCLPSKF